MNAQGVPEPKKQVLIITGMSGSGKHTAFKALEDMGFFCVDNLPTALIPRLIQMTIASGGKIDKLAIVVDVRLGELEEDFKRLVGRLRQLPLASKVIFFDASERVLVHRYSETRRIHPLARGASLLEGFRAEQELLAGVRSLADMVIDTTDYSAQDLRKFIYETFRDRENPKQLDVSIVSFGFKRGLPLHADLVFDMRFLPNPNYIPHLKSKTGLDQEIVDYMKGFRETLEIIHKVQDMLEYLLPRFAREGKSYCTVAIGCTGGKHRSVMVARQLAAALEDEGFEINLVHRDLHLE